MKNLTHIIESHGHVIHSILVLLSLQTKDCFCEQRKIKTPHSNFEVCVFVRVIFLCFFVCVIITLSVFRGQRYFLHLSLSFTPLSIKQPTFVRCVKCFSKRALNILNLQNMPKFFNGRRKLF